MNRKLYERMRNDEELSLLIEEVGGLNKVIFVALDVEAAVVLSDSIPLPLELSLVPLENDYELSSFHCFLHPGKVTDLHTAKLLSCGRVSGCHYIPFKNASFLCRDYTQIAEKLMPFLTCDRVIFVNKGSTIDVYALMWIFAAARATDANSDIPILNASDIFCFDIDTVVKVLTEINKNNVPGYKDIELGCWYHDKMKTELANHVTYAFDMHCALHDTESLVRKILQLL